MQEDRRLAVLRAIVEDYVSTREPVGSKALVERHRLGVSPATVRNDMAALEEEGLIAQPHTSAGRIPTDKGYRFFVDRLTQIKPMSAAERRAISTFLEGAHDLDDVIQRSVRVLAQLTQQVAIVQYPTLARSTRAAHRAGRARAHPAADRADPLHRPGRAARARAARARSTTRPLADLRSRVLRGRRRASGSPTPPTRSARWPSRSTTHDRTQVAVIAAALVEAMSNERNDERVVVGGTANLARFGDGFDQSIKPMLEALEEHVVLLKLLGEATSSDSITVRIGHEGPYQELATTSVVATGYGPGEEAVGSLGIVGPTRMDYPGSMAAVRAVARYVSTILDEA